MNNNEELKFVVINSHLKKSCFVFFYTKIMKFFPPTRNTGFQFNVFRTLRNHSRELRLWNFVAESYDFVIAERISLNDSLYQPEREHWIYENRMFILLSSWKAVQLSAIIVSRLRLSGTSTAKCKKKLFMLRKFRFIFCLFELIPSLSRCRLKLRR